ncbi:MAG: hypothetical protein M5U28_18335 [Sandaracinaceae bacterium]|nr:hypothetical protein [Sandaracinaceae bacterium]
MTRERIVAAYPDRLCHRAPRRGDVVFRTSGSSGLFMEIAYSEDANDWLDAAYARGLFATGYRPWHSLAYFWWEDEPRARTVYERAGLMNKTLLPPRSGPARAAGGAAPREAPLHLHLPSSMMMVARLVEEQGIDELRPAGIICHGELMPRPIQQDIARIFRCPVWNQYGAQEFNRIAWDCGEHGPLHVEADTVYVEVVDDAGRPVPDGETGELVITGLRNRLMPLFRYRIGDIGRRVPGACPCGRGLPPHRGDGGASRRRDHAGRRAAPRTSHARAAHRAGARRLTVSPGPGGARPLRAARGVAKPSLRARGASSPPPSPSCSEQARGSGSATWARSALAARQAPEDRVGGEVQRAGWAVTRARAAN